MEKEATPFTPDPVFGSLLGLCPVIFVTANFGMGVIVAVGLLLSILGMSLIIPAIRGLFPERLRAPLALGLAASLTALYATAAQAYSPLLASMADIFISLTLVNCLLLIVLRGGIHPDAGPMPPLLVTVLRYFLAIVALGAIRELFGRGTLTLPVPGEATSVVKIFEAAPLALLATPAGGFVLLGCLAALYRFVERRFLGRRMP